MDKEFNIENLTLTYDMDFLKKWYEHQEVYFEYETMRYKISFENISLGYAYYYKRGPILITYNEKKYTESDEDYEESLKEFEKYFDIKYNCFGYVLFESRFWYEPTCGIMNKKEIAFLLKTMGYIEIDKPQPNSIAVFFNGERASHIAKTEDGVLWIAKDATYPPLTTKSLSEITETITNDNIVKRNYSDLMFYIKKS